MDAPQMRLASVRGNHLDVKIPELRLAECNGGPLDLIWLAHNSIRRQSIDFFYVLAFAQRFAHELTPAEANQILDWFHHFATLVEIVFDCENTVLFPWLIGCSIPTDDDMVLGQATRNNIYARHKTIMSTILGLRSQMEHHVGIAPLSEMIKRSEGLISSLANYFAHQENILNVLIENRCGKQEKQEFQTVFFRFVLTLPRPCHFFTAIGRTLQSKRARLELQRLFFREANPMLRTSLKIRLIKERRTYHQDFLDPPRHFFDQWSGARTGPKPIPRIT